MARAGLQYYRIARGKVGAKGEGNEERTAMGRLIAVRSWRRWGVTAAD
jgi:hypothetical protein